MAYVIRVNRNTNSYIVRRIVRKVVVNRVGKAGKTGPQGPAGDPATNLVQSVNGKQGVVVLDASDVGADAAGSASNALEQANTYTDEQIDDLAIVASTGSYNDLEDKPTIPVVDYPVTSVNGRTGDVTGLAEQALLDMVEEELFQDIQTGDSATLASANSYTDAALATKADAAATQTALNGKADFPTTNSSVPVRSASGAQGSLIYSQSATIGSIAQRDASGAINTATATTNTQAVNKAQMDAADALKVNKAGDILTGLLSSTLASSVGYNQVRAGNTVAWGADSQGRFAVGINGTILFDVATNGLTVGNVRYLTGTGFPNGVVSAPVGSIYIDTAVTNGASSWIKKSGTGNTGWQVLEGDTGWRRLETYLDTITFSATVSATQFIMIRRVNNTVELSGRLVPVVTTTNVPRSVFTTAALNALIGFKAFSNFPAIVSVTASNGWGTPGAALIRSAYGSSVAVDAFEAAQFTSGSNISINFVWTTTNGWPTTLPGTAA